jgi:Na+/H+ antiporter NhaD/arsenite permease-like protein
MVVSAQLRLGGFYTALARRMAGVPLAPGALLGLVVFASGGLSALLANDIVCLAVTPVLLEGCRKRGLDPVPFLLALACAANVGSAATLIGNPQNMLIGQVMRLSFAGYAVDALAPVALGLLAVWGLAWAMHHRRWRVECHVPAVAAPPLDRWQSGKGLAVLTALVACFLWGPWPREVVALACAGVLLLSRRLASRNLFALIDWQLLLLFLGLFMVNHALNASGLFARLVEDAARSGLDLGRPAWLFAATAALSNLVSNVPAVMLLLPLAQGPQAGLALALASTLAGNLFLLGSIANLIVAEQAALHGVAVTWRGHMRLGVPVTLATLGLAGIWLWLRWDSLAVLG